ncbi:acyl-CoA thioesterase [Tsuneonella sp. HG222]
MSEPTAEDLVARLLELLDPKDLGQDRFEGPRKPGGVGRVYGGQVIAQALVAAQRTVDRGRRAHSLHAYFLRGGSEDHPIEFEVARVFEGRSFANRRITASQQGQAILAASVSFQAQEEGLQHQAAAMPEVPPPEDLASEADLISALPESAKRGLLPFLLEPRPVDTRPVDPRALLDRSELPPRQQVWFRMRAAAPADPLIHQAILAYWSDMRLMLTSTLPHPVAFALRDIKGASLDHTIWFHTDVKIDDWLLYDMESPWSGGARGLNFGRIFSRDGTLVASVAQEGMFRPAR